MLLGPVEGADTEQWRRMIDVNCLGLLYCTHAALPAHARGGRGPHRQRLLGRGARRRARQRRLQHDQVGRRRVLRGRCARRSLHANIRVTIIEPGYVETELQGHNEGNPIVMEAMAQDARGARPAAGRGHRRRDPLRARAPAARLGQRGAHPARRSRRGRAAKCSARAHLAWRHDMTTTPPRSSSSRTTTRRGRSSPTTSPPTATSCSSPTAPRTRCACSRRSSPTSALIDVGLPDGSGLDIVRRVRDADGVASRVDPRTPLLRAQRPRRRARPRPRRSSAAPTTTSPSRSSYPELRGRVARAAAPRGERRATAAACASASSRSTRPRARRRRRAARGSSCRQGVRAAAHAGRRAHAGLHEGRAAARRLGLPARAARRARSTRHACRLRQKLARRRRPVRRSTSGASATGWSTRRWRHDASPAGWSRRRDGARGVPS